MRWLGVFALNELPDLEHELRPFALVLNTDPRYKPGTHWLAIFAPRDGCNELFDSFGLPSNFYGLNVYNLLANSTTFQSNLSAVCGHYCIFFIYLRARNYSNAAIISLLKTQLPKVDTYVLKSVYQLQSQYRLINPCNNKGQCSRLKCSFC